MLCDLESQLEGAQKIFSTGQQVVGWYHSHPTFQDNPSGRDIETQTDFQAYWSSPVSASVFSAASSTTCDSAIPLIASSSSPQSPSKPSATAAASSPHARSSPRTTAHASLANGRAICSSPVKIHQNKRTARTSPIAHQLVPTQTSDSTTIYCSNDDERELAAGVEPTATVPFVGMILSPYYPLYRKSEREPCRSQFKFLIVRDGIPYQIPTRILRRDRIHKELPLQVGRISRWILASRTRHRLEEKIATNYTIVQKVQLLAYTF